MIAQAVLTQGPLSMITTASKTIKMTLVLLLILVAWTGAKEMYSNN